MSSGLLVSFDGLDSSGKATQSKALVNHLAAQGVLVRFFSSPDYSTPSGKELKLRLQNKLDNWQTTSWQEKMKYFADNRAEHRDEVVDVLQQGGIVIYDRYVPSSIAFMTQEAAQSGEYDRANVQATVSKIEYETNSMPHEDVSLFFDIPPQVAMNLLEGRKHHTGDEAEYTDYIQVQEALHVEYVRMVQENPSHMLHVQCMDGPASAKASAGKLKGIQEISLLVRSMLAEKFPNHAQLFA